jgi:hypothetical protein
MPRASSIAEKAASAGSLLFFCVDIPDHPSVAVPDHPSDSMAPTPESSGTPPDWLQFTFLQRERKQKLLTICKLR